VPGTTLRDSRTGKDGPAVLPLPALTGLLSSSVRRRSRTVAYVPGDVILREGDPGSDVCILLSGECQVAVHGEAVNTIRAGELFGEIACLEAGTRTATVRAATECSVLSLPGDALVSELRRSPALLEKCLRTIAQRLRHISGREAIVRDEQRRLRQVLEELHPSLDRFASYPSLSVEVRWEPMTAASGDYYDILELAPGRIMFVLGDVMGHGASTTPIIGMIHSQLHELAAADRQPHELLAHLHRHLLRHGPANVFMTMTVLMLDVETNVATFAVAGPPSPLLQREGSSRPLTDQCGWTLAYPFSGVSFQTECIQLAPGDTILFFTDGLSDAARGPDLDCDLLGLDGLGHILSRVCSERGSGIADGVFAGVDVYRGTWPVDDDATALTVRLH
jgi:serine phosphatase RsbU (regulator of sigma subunit)